jgi:hypothetical protein
VTSCDDQQECVNICDFRPCGVNANCKPESANKCTCTCQPGFVPDAKVGCSSIADSSVDYQLLTSLITVLRSSYKNFDQIVELLKFDEYFSGRISLVDVARKCNDLNFITAHLDDLKVAARKVHAEDLTVKSFIQTQLRSFISDATVKINDSAVEIAKKIFRSDEIETFFGSFAQVSVICDTFHIDRDLPDSARGKNFAVLANFVHVHGDITWNLSGKDQTTLEQAGRNEHGEGEDGANGRVGESGGNCEIKCRKSFINSESLKIISNGGNGANGQDGGDGRNGQDGNDAAAGDFFDSAFYAFRVRFDNEKERHAWAAKNTDNYNEYLKNDRKQKRKFIFVQRMDLNGRGFMLVRGSNGEAGMAGGRGGLGGEGGHRGSIKVDCPHLIGVTYESKYGRRGSDGSDGVNGIKGRDGRDAYKLVK